MPFPFLKLFRKLTFWDERGYLKVSKKLNSVWSAISVSLGHPTATPLRHLSGLTDVRPGALNDLITTLCLIAFTSMCNPHPYILPWPLIHPDVLLLIWLPTLACPDCWVCRRSFCTGHAHGTYLITLFVFDFGPLPHALGISCLLGHLVLCSAKSWSAVVRSDEPVNQLNLSFTVPPSLPFSRTVFTANIRLPFSSIQNFRKSSLQLSECRVWRKTDCRGSAILTAWSMQEPITTFWEEVPFSSSKKLIIGLTKALEDLNLWVTITFPGTCVDVSMVCVDIRVDGMCRCGGVGVQTYKMRQSSRVFCADQPERRRWQWQWQ
ncbi:hypothetical protein PAPYR_8441 [Paratrimastix pyriformis]|uniref:Uncharacterized protein n=1 Tax=Paratrimastix pyriformis TaxID=342808 RepID=A0ABQ8UHN4_9EUKA|nr:hypothetical protein PAPYR_8441 [Paratrimastix pyriformis]